MEFLNVMYEARLTENYKLKAANSLISNLRLKIGMNESYIQELEDNLKNLELKIKELEDQLEEKVLQIKKIQDKYSDDVQQHIKTDILYQKYFKVVTELEEENKMLRRRNDLYISELAKLRK